jgi:hypothetical protein
LYAKKSKCRFRVGVIDYLGHFISEQGVSIDPSKITTMSNWLIPSTIKSLRVFWDLPDITENLSEDMGLLLLL